MSSSDLTRLAVLIDADNATATLTSAMLAELAKYGTLTVKRAYGDWTTQRLVGWKKQLNSHAIQPVQQFAYTTGKNATDSAMIIDAMDLLYSDTLDGFCIVSSDSDFTRLATRLREAGKTVYGLGQRKTPEAFIAACDRFVFAEVLDGSKQKPTKKTASSRGRSAQPDQAAPPDQADRPAPEQDDQPTQPAKKAAKKTSRRTKAAPPEPEDAAPETSTDADDSADSSDTASAASAAGTTTVTKRARGKGGQRTTKETPPEPVEIDEPADEDDPDDGDDGDEQEFPSIEEILQPAIDGTAKESGWASLGSVGSYVNKRHSSFDPRNYGYPRLSVLVKDLDWVDVKEVPDANDFPQLWVRVSSDPA